MTDSDKVDSLAARQRWRTGSQGRKSNGCEEEQCDSSGKVESKGPCFKIASGGCQSGVD